MSCHSVAVVLILVQIKQIRINIYKRDNTRNTVQTVQNTVNTSTHITETPTHTYTHMHTSTQWFVFGKIQYFGRTHTHASTVCLCVYCNSHTKKKTLTGLTTSVFSVNYEYKLVLFIISINFSVQSVDTVKLHTKKDITYCEFAGHIVV